MTAYNSAIAYNEQHFVYNGTLIISAPSLPHPITIGGVTVVVNPTQDYSNSTSVGIVSYDIMPTGIISIEATDSQYEAIVDSTLFILNTTSGELSVSNTQSHDSTTSVSTNLSNSSLTAEVTLEAI